MPDDMPERIVAGRREGVLGWEGGWMEGRFTMPGEAAYVRAELYETAIKRLEILTKEPTP